MLTEVKKLIAELEAEVKKLEEKLGFGCTIVATPAATTAVPTEAAPAAAEAPAANTDAAV